MSWHLHSLSTSSAKRVNCRTGDLKTGYMEKRIGENSSRQSLPESWKWQKRYFVLSEPKGLLYYFKSADDPPTYRGIINVRECKVEDVDANGLPKTAARSKYDLDGGGGTVSLLIKLSHKVCFSSFPDSAGCLVTPSSTHCAIPDQYISLHF